MAEQKPKTYSGTWFARVTYPNRDDDGEEITHNRMEAQKIGREVVFTSRPNEEGSHMVIRLSFDDGVATGTWHETTSPTGTYAGATYSGAGQLLVSGDEQSMDGQWAGMGYNHTSQKPHVYVGTWKLSRTKA